MKGDGKKILKLVTGLEVTYVVKSNFDRIKFNKYLEFTVDNMKMEHWVDLNFRMSELHISRTLGPIAKNVRYV